MYDQTIPFYLGRTTTLVGYRDELALGIDAEPDARSENRDMDRPVARSTRATR